MATLWVMGVDFFLQCPVPMHNSPSLVCFETCFFLGIFSFAVVFTKLFGVIMAKSVENRGK